MTDQIENRPRTVTVYREFIVRGDRFYLGQRAANERWGANQWEAFGGKLDQGQDVAHVAEEEVFQETGLVTVPLTKLKAVLNRTLLSENIFRFTIY